jgi:two-component system chemotaxis response regulator CheB
MTIRVLVVDDSTFFCKRIREILEEDPELKVVGMAYNGLEAVELAAALKPDVVTMDVEMPIMDGITAVKNIMSSYPCPILMLSVMTHFGAKSTLDALSAGAVDFLPKQLEDIDINRETAKAQLRHRVRSLATHAAVMRSRSAVVSRVEKPSIPPAVVAKTPKSSARLGHVDLLVIAASTGGPVAIQKVLADIPANCPVPIVLIQHMPQNFTKSFAERLNQHCHIQVREAEEGDSLLPGWALLAPGGMQLQFKSVAGVPKITLRPKQEGELYSPCIDLTFESLAEQFKGQLLAVVLTGMGSDGKVGAIKLKQTGAHVWAQDEASSTIYGMPRVIIEANLADKVMSLSELAASFKQLQ